MKLVRVTLLVLSIVSFLLSTASAGKLARIYVCPGSVALRPGVRQHFRVFGLDAEGNEVATQGAVTWSVDKAAGSITKEGIFVAGTKLGTYGKAVRASVNGLHPAYVVVEVTDPNPEGGYRFERAWGDKAPGQMNPFAVVVAANGDFYVSEPGVHRVQKFDQNGNYLAMWGTYGTENGQFNTPKGMAIDMDSNPYVADTGNDRVQKFDRNGKFLMSFGIGRKTREIFNAHVESGRVKKPSLADGEVIEPKGVAVDAKGNVFVVDAFRICEFSPIGKFIRAMDSEAFDSTHGWNYESVAVDPTGSIYATDIINDHVVKFDGTGRCLQALGRAGAGDGQFRMPKAIAAGRDGLVYIADVYNQCVQVFDSGGRFILKWSLQRSEDGNSTEPSGLATDAEGSIYVADMFDAGVQKLGRDGKLLARYGWKGPANGAFRFPWGIAADARGSIYVADYSAHRVQKFDSNGGFLATWGSKGTGPALFDGPCGVAVSSSGYVYVTDCRNRRVQKFDSNGKYILDWGRDGTENGQFCQRPPGCAPPAVGACVPLECL